MNIKQRHCLSEMTGSSSFSLSICSFILLPRLVLIFLPETSVFFLPSPRLQHNAKRDHSYKAWIFHRRLYLFWDVNTLLYVEKCWWIAFVSSLVWCFLRASQHFQFITIKTMPCAIISKWGQREQQLGCGTKVFQRFKYLIVNDKHHFTTI